MPDPIDFNDVNIGFQNELKSRTNFTAGFPVMKGVDTAIVGTSTVVTAEQGFIKDGMLVGLTRAGEAYRYNSSGELPTYVLATSALSTVLSLTAAPASTVKMADADGPINFETSGVKVGDTLTITGVNDDFVIVVTAISADGLTLTFDNTSDAVVQDDGGATPYDTTLDDDFGDDADNYVGATISFARAAGNFGRFHLAADTYKTFNGQHNQPSKKITLIKANYQWETDHLDTTDFANATYVNNSHPISENLDPFIIDGTGNNVAITFGGTDSITFVGIDLVSAGLKDNDKIIFIPPATWNDDRDGGTTPKVASTVGWQTLVLTNVVFAAGDTTADFTVNVDGTAALKTPAGSFNVIHTFALASGTLDVSVAATSTVIMNDAGGAIDFEALGVKIGDTIKIVGDNKTFSIVVKAISGTTVTFNNTNDAVTKDDGGTAYTGGNGGDFGDDSADDYQTKVVTATEGAAYKTGTIANFDEDFDGGEIRFNRSVADIKPGTAVSCKAGKLALTSAAADEIVGFIVSTKALPKIVEVSPFSYVGQQ